MLFRGYVCSSEAWLSELGYTLKLVVNVDEHQTETNGIMRFPCDSMAFLSNFPTYFTILFSHFSFLSNPPPLASGVARISDWG